LISAGRPRLSRTMKPSSSRSNMVTTPFNTSASIALATRAPSSSTILFAGAKGLDARSAS
jgi:hypothetical protein